MIVKFYKDHAYNERKLKNVSTEPVFTRDVNWNPRDGRTTDLVVNFQLPEIEQDVDYIEVDGTHWYIINKTYERAQQVRYVFRRDFLQDFVKDVSLFMTNRRKVLDSELSSYNKSTPIFNSIKVGQLNLTDRVYAVLFEKTANGETGIADITYPIDVNLTPDYTLDTTQLNTDILPHKIGSQGVIVSGTVDGVTSNYQIQWFMGYDDNPTVALTPYSGSNPVQVSDLFTATGGTTLALVAFNSETNTERLNSAYQDTYGHYIDNYEQYNDKILKDVNTNQFYNSTFGLDYLVGKVTLPSLSFDLTGRTIGSSSVSFNSTKVAELNTLIASMQYDYYEKYQLKLEATSSSIGSITIPAHDKCVDTNFGVSIIDITQNFMVKIGALTKWYEQNTDKLFDIQIVFGNMDDIVNFKSLEKSYADYYITKPFEIGDKLEEINCKSYRLLPPDHSSGFEFNIGKNNNTIFPIKFSYNFKPLRCVIKVTPNFEGLNGADYTDGRGLVHYSSIGVTMVNDAWVQFKQTNANYEVIQQRQIQYLDDTFANRLSSAEFQRDSALAKGIFSTVLGVGAGIATMGLGGIGSLALTAVGTATGGIGGIGNTITNYANAQQSISSMKEQHALDRAHQIDQYNLNISNIKQTPDSLVRVSELNSFNNIGYYLEIYSCTDEEKEYARFYIDKFGQEVNKIETKLPESGYYKGSVITCSSIYTDDIDRELQAGIWIGG